MLGSAEAEVKVEEDESGFSVLCSDWVWKLRRDAMQEGLQSVQQTLIERFARMFNIVATFGGAPWQMRNLPSVMQREIREVEGYVVFCGLWLQIDKQIGTEGDGRSDSGLCVTSLSHDNGGRLKVCGEDRPFRERLHARQTLLLSPAQRILTGIDHAEAGGGPWLDESTSVCSNFFMSYAKKVRLRDAGREQFWHAKVRSIHAAAS